jgi:hypothetical protein
MAEENKDLEKDEGSGCGGLAGFQAPLGVRKRKKHVEAMLLRHPDLGFGAPVLFFSRLDEAGGENIGRALECGMYDEVARMIREHAIRELVASKVKEVVRKKPGAGGFVLYSPNQGKKRPSKAVQEFPTRAAAKRAELARFPPKDPGKLKRMRKDIQKLLKDPKKSTETNIKATKAKATDKPKTKKHESVQSEQVLRRVISHLIRESLFREERAGSEWDEVIQRLSSKALTGDKKFQNLQRGIEKKTEGVLQAAMAAVAKGVKDKKVKVKNLGVKQSKEQGKIYLPFVVTLGEVDVGPFFIYTEAGVPKIEVSEQARAAMTKADPDETKTFRAELIMIQERVLDEMDDLVQAIENRDKYLDKAEEGIDKFVAGLSPLQLSLLKSLLVKKYRKVA